MCGLCMRYRNQCGQTKAIVVKHFIAQIWYIAYHRSQKNGIKSYRRDHLYIDF